MVGDVGMGFNPAMLGHAEEVWGLAAHPTLPQFATAGHDRLLQMWDSLSHTVVWSKDIGVSINYYLFFNIVSSKWIVRMFDWHSDYILIEKYFTFIENMSNDSKSYQLNRNYIF